MHKNTYNYPIFFIHLIIRTCLTLSEPPTIFCRFYDLCSYLLSLRACFSCHTFFPGTIEEKSREKKKVDFVFSAVSAGSLSFFCTGSSKLVGLATRTTHSSPMPGATSSSMSSIYRSSPAKRSKLGGGAPEVLAAQALEDVVVHEGGGGGGGGSWTIVGGEPQKRNPFRPCPTKKSCRRCILCKTRKSSNSTYRVCVVTRARLTTRPPVRSSTSNLW